MMNKNLNVGLLVLRITLGVLMLLHGIAKLTHDLSGINGLLESKGLPSFIAYGVYVGEIIVPLLIIIGFRTRIAGVFFAVNMLFALFLAHANDIFSLSKTGGWAVELIALYLFGAIVLFFTGAGKYALSTSSKWD
jgi:putative oxidoreductase